MGCSFYKELHQPSVRCLNVCWFHHSGPHQYIITLIPINLASGTLVVYRFILSLHYQYTYASVIVGVDEDTFMFWLDNLARRIYKSSAYETA